MPAAPAEEVERSALVMVHPTREEDGSLTHILHTLLPEERPIEVRAMQNALSWSLFRSNTSLLPHPAGGGGAGALSARGRRVHGGAAAGGAPHQLVPQGPGGPAAGLPRVRERDRGVGGRGRGGGAPARRWGPGAADGAGLLLGLPAQEVQPGPLPVAPALVRPGRGQAVVHEAQAPPHAGPRRRRHLARGQPRRRAPAQFGVWSTAERTASLLLCIHPAHTNLPPVFRPRNDKNKNRRCSTGSRSTRRTASSSSGPPTARSSSGGSAPCRHASSWRRRTT